MIGTTVSRYRIVAKLGGGGMGVVYDAEDSELGRHVAIKFLPEDAVASADALERFKREARAASALDHPHICTVFDIGTHEGQPYLVMERLRGETLEYAIAGRPLPVEKIVKLGEQIADALDAAHRAGIVHRDLKPANLFLTERGEAKILDFGLAKMAPTGGVVTADAPTVAGDYLTEAGATVGTVAYMSPEQARGEAVDARSDLFSFGVVLYEMATGRLPFPGESSAELFAAILRNEPVLPSQLNPEVPPKLEEIVLKSLEKDPALRYQSAAELRGDLVRLRRDASHASTSRLRQPSARSAGPARHGLWWGAAILSAATLLAIGIVSTRGGRPAGIERSARAATSATHSAAPARSIAVLPFVNMSSDPEQEYFSDGISEELLNLLTKIPQLRVTSRSSAFSFKGQKLEIVEIARRLNVAHVLEGSVRKSGNQVRVTAQLIEAGSDTHVWSETYDRTLDDIFAIQDEIAADVVSQLQVTLLREAPKSRQTDSRAYALYLQGVQIGHQMTPESFEQSEKLLRQTVEIDPTYVPAWTELAWSYFYSSNTLNVRPPEEGTRLALEMAQRALALDADHAPTYALLGTVARSRGDLAVAARDLERALALEPANLGVLVESAKLLSSLGRQEDAIAIMEHVIARDPLNLRSYVTLGVAYFHGERYDDAGATFRRVLSLNPARGVAHFGLGLSLLQAGKRSAALEEFEKEAVDPWRGIGLMLAYHALGRRAESDAALAEGIEKYAQGSAYNIAYVLAYRGEADRAFEWLDSAATYGDSGLSMIVTDPLLAGIRSDPRWLPFLRKIGKAPEQLAQIRFEVDLPD
jgi:serine/threonine protein kinase